MAIHGVGQPASRRPSGTEAVLRRNQLLTYPFPIASRESAVARDAPMAACEPMGHLFLRPEKFEGKVSKFGILFPQAAPGSECHAHAGCPRRIDDAQTSRCPCQRTPTTKWWMRAGCTAPGFSAGSESSLPGCCANHLTARRCCRLGIGTLRITDFAGDDESLVSPEGGVA